MFEVGQEVVVVPTNEVGIIDEVCCGGESFVVQVNQLVLDPSDESVCLDIVPKYPKLWLGELRPFVRSGY